jgi:hypothetical protein
MCDPNTRVERDGVVRIVVVAAAVVVASYCYYPMMSS